MAPVLRPLARHLRTRCKLRTAKRVYDALFQGPRQFTVCARLEETGGQRYSRLRLPRPLGYLQVVEQVTSLQAQEPGFGGKCRVPPRLQWSRVRTRRAGCPKPCGTESAVQGQSFQAIYALQTFAGAPLCESLDSVACVDHRRRIVQWPILSCSCHSV